MFNDERIINERGIIFKKANLLAIFISVIFFIGRLLIYIHAGEGFKFFQFLTEVSVILINSIIIIYGELAFESNDKDERSIALKNQYYSRMGKYLLYSIILGFSLTIIAFNFRLGNDFPPNYIIFVFEIAGLIFFYYQFKKHNISINYSFIDFSKKEYYKKVLVNIGQMSLVVLGIYVSCSFICLIIFQKLGYLLAFLIAGFISIISLGLGYLFLSFIEKIDYDQETENIKLSFIILAVIAIIILIVKGIISIKYYNLVSSIDSDSLNFPIGETLSKYLNLMVSLDFQYVTIFGVSLAYLIPHFKGKKIINIAILLNLTLLCMKELVKFIQKCLAFFLMDTIETISIYSSINQVVFYVLFALDLGVFIVMIIGLIKEANYSKLMILFPIAKTVVFLIYIFMSMQNKIWNAEKLSMISSIVITSLYILMLCLKKNKKQQVPSF